MTTIHVTSPANVETTLNMWFAEQLSYIELPAYFDTAGYNIAYEWPEVPLVPPCFSFNHRSVMRENKFQGNVASDGESVVCAYAQMDINCWVSRDQKYQDRDIWRPRLQWMEMAVNAIYTLYPTVVIQDTQSNPDYPMPVQYKINLSNLQYKDTGADPNPAFKRRWIMLSYNWMLRANA